MRVSRKARVAILVSFVLLAVGAFALNRYRGVASMELDTTEASEFADALMAKDASISSVYVGYRFAGTDAATVDLEVRAPTWEPGEANDVVESVGELLKDSRFQTSFAEAYDRRYGIVVSGADVAMLKLFSGTRDVPTFSYSFSAPTWKPKCI